MSQRRRSVPFRMESTQKPTISAKSDWSESRYLKRRRDLHRKLPNGDQSTYAVMRKFRLKQKKMLDKADAGGDYSDPDPYSPTFVFYCFQGTLEH